MNYYGSNNDWWSYLQHSLQSKERKNHKYYARERIGTYTVSGHPRYRYFYSSQEYDAFLKNKNQAAQHLQKMDKLDQKRFQQEHGNQDYTAKKVPGGYKLTPARYKAITDPNDPDYSHVTEITRAGHQFNYRSERNVDTGEVRKTRISNKESDEELKRNLVKKGFYDTTRSRSPAQKAVSNAKRAYHKVSVATQKGKLKVKSLLTKKASELESRPKQVNYYTGNTTTLPNRDKRQEAKKNRGNNVTGSGWYKSTASVRGRGKTAASRALRKVASWLG